MSDEASASTGQKRRRTRSGCLNCRRKRKKCDDVRPICTKCERSGEECEWDALIKFRPPTGLAGSRDSTPSGPITLHVQSDSEGTVESVAGQSYGSTFVRTPSRNATLNTEGSSNRHLKRRFGTTSGSFNETLHRSESQIRRDSQSQRPPNGVTLHERSGGLATEARSTDLSYDVTIGGPGSNRNSDRNNEDTSRVSGTALQTSPPSAEQDAPVEEGYNLPPHTDETWTAQDMSSLGEITSLDMAMLPDHVLSPSISSSYNLEDGIFEPGSAYQNLFQSLRSHVLRTAQIESDASENNQASVSRRYPIAPGHSNAVSDRSTGLAGSAARSGKSTNAQEFELPPAQEYLLWKAWTEEVSIWSLDIRGDAGGAEEAVFWCFARMDLCGGLISLERTLIPVEKWTKSSISEMIVKTYPRSGNFHDYAKIASNIIAQAMHLFASYHASEGAFGFSAANRAESEAYGTRWRRLFDDIQEWFSTRPVEMLPVMAMSAKDCGSPFPTILYTNAAAISGNQFAHTAAIMMLQRKPREIVLGKIRSILWHARQICGIALSNDHHGAWTNTVQPIWIAGRLMSHPQEHDVIIRLLERIERETGWATKWRIDDLMEHWGDAED
ncbi:hypothetical protein MBLNU13_g07881t2 [Cladosporium sp. NU13]